MPCLGRRSAQTLSALAVASALVAAPAGAAPAPPAATPAAADSAGTAAYDETYWEPALGKEGAELEAALHGIISAGVDPLTYSEVWDALQVTDEDPDDSANVVAIYSGLSLPKSDHGGNVDQWNREHVWPQSHGDFGTATGPGTDLHHLRPEDVTVNADRGNLDFDAGGTENDEAPGNYADGDSWEPRDEVKGDVARAILYMSVRWEGGDGFADLEVNDVTGNGGVPFTGKLSTLLAWHAQDPPTAAEVTRNDVIYEQFQHNRNPFVDHPEWADSIWG